MVMPKSVYYALETKQKKPKGLFNTEYFSFKNTEKNGMGRKLH